MEISISVIIPVHPSHLCYIPNIVMQMEKQTKKPLEVILVCCGVTADFMRQLTLKTTLDVKFIVLPRINLPGINRNIGAKASKGEYVAFIDADDVTNPEKLEICQYIINKYKADV